jgi:hypothetical protein
MIQVICVSKKVNLPQDFSDRRMDSGVPGVGVDICLHMPIRALHKSPRSA